MNNIELRTKVNLSIKLLGLFIILLMLHNISGIVDNLGIITDLFIIIGAYQTGEFFINKEVRTSIINKSKQLIDFESFDGFVNNTINAIERISEKSTEIEKDFNFSVDDLLNSNPLTAPLPERKRDNTYTDSI